MPRDYKHVPKQKDKSNGGILSAIITFATGLSLGLFVAYFIYLNQTDSSYIPFNFKLDSQEPGEPKQDKIVEIATPDIVEEEQPIPKFEFYDILPNKEINISEWVADDPSSSVTVNKNDTSVYILQVGSFKQLETADQVKAQLALLGITANIQHVVINGQDSRYRVRVGPYSEQSKLNEERKRLMENNLEFMLLKLQADDPRLSEG
jgi:cell division protein FtsN